MMPKLVIEMLPWDDGTWWIVRADFGDDVTLIGQGFQPTAAAALVAAHALTARFCGDLELMAEAVADLAELPDDDPLVVSRLHALDRIMPQLLAGPA